MDKNKKILSCDFSLTGTCFFYNIGSLDNFEFKYFSDKKFDLKNNECIEIPNDYKSEDKLDLVIKEFLHLVQDRDLFIIESPSFNSLNNNSAFKDGYGIMLYFCRILGIQTILVPPISLKLFTTGNSKAVKDDMRTSLLQDYKIDYKEISKSKWDNICDSRALYELGKTYLECNRLPAKKGCVDTSDIKPVECLPLYKQQVIYKLYGREDLCKEVVKRRNKNKIDK